MLPDRLTHSLVALLLGGTLTLATAPAAQARAVTLSSAALGATSCTVTVNGERARQFVVGNVATLNVRLGLDSHAASGLHEVELSCPPQRPVIRRVRVQRSRQARRGAALIRSARLSHSAELPAGTVVAPPGPVLPAVEHPVLSAEAVAYADMLWATRWEGTYLPYFVGTGQCTELVAHKRPDIIARSVKVTIAKWKMGGGLGHVPALNWNATTWDANAAASGMDVGATPRAGAVMVYHYSPGFPVPSGHVAYVDAVHPDGSLSITEEHSPVLGQVRQRVVRAYEMSGKDIDFIY
jgi:hypothetical protein